MKRLIAALGIGAALWAAAACGGSEGGVVAAEGGNGDKAVAGTESEQDAVERIETVDTGTASSDLVTQSDRADAALSARGGAVAELSSPEDMSTGPILQWTEFDPAIGGHGSLYSIGDGRVVIRGETQTGVSQLWRTSDGSDWSVVPLPSGLSPHTFDLTGARWMVARVPG